MWGKAGGRGEVGVCGGNADALARDADFALLLLSLLLHLLFDSQGDALN